MSSPDHGQKEILARSRRIETRLTSLCQFMGVPTGAQTPEYNNGKLTIHSAHTSVKELLDSVPPDSVGHVKVYLGDHPLMTIVLPGN